MRLCMRHWNALRDAIKVEGLDHLVSRDGQEVVGKVADQLKGDMSTYSFDPLMNANMAIWSRCLRICGFSLMVQNPDGSDKCPLCEINTNCKCPVENCVDEWVVFAAKDQRKQWEQMTAQPESDTVN